MSFVLTYVAFVKRKSHLHIFPHVVFPQVLIGLQEKDSLGQERETPLQVCYDSMLTGCPDPIVRIQSLSAPTRFVTVSENGQTTFYDSKMRCVFHL